MAPVTVPRLFGAGIVWRRIVLAYGGWGCGIAERGQAYCWGRNEHGELGMPPDSQRHTDPVLMAGLPPLRDIAVSSWHGCGLGANGDLYCWGRNLTGELGRGTRTAWERPGVVSGGARFTGIAVTDFTSCGLTERGAAYCWGFNDHGILGHTADEDCADVFEVPDGPPRAFRCTAEPDAVVTDLRFEQIVLGGLAPCGLTTAGQVHCWAGRQVERGDSLVVEDIGVYPVQGIPGFTSIAAGGSHWCGLTNDGTAYCWGGNLYGQLGRGYERGADTDTPKPPLGELRFRALSAGGDHTCGLTTDAQVYCWGRNGQGQLGNGTTESSHTPVLARFPG